MTSIFSESWCGIVFDGRNQQYGAYELRKSTERNMLLAILFSVSILSVGINIILLENPNKSFISVVDDEDDDMEDDARVFTEVELQPPPANEPEQDAPTPPQPEPTPVPAATERLTVPIIVDEATSIIDTVPSQDSFGEAQPGTTTQAGEPAFASVEMIESGSGTGISVQTIFDRVEKMPEFPGGEIALLRFIGEKTKYPSLAIETEMEATVHVQFVVDRDGSLTDVRVARKNYKCLDDEAMRVVKSMPKWKPGSQNGEPVKVRFIVPIRFELK